MCLGKQPATVRGWCREGRIEAVNVGSSVRPRYRISVEVLSEVLLHPPTSWGIRRPEQMTSSLQDVHLLERIGILERQLQQALADAQRWQQAARGTDAAAMGYRDAFIQLAGPNDLDSMPGASAQ